MQAGRDSGLRTYSTRKFVLPDKTFHERTNNKLPSKPSVANLHSDYFQSNSTLLKQQANKDLASYDLKYGRARNNNTTIYTVGGENFDKLPGLHTRGYQDSTKSTRNDFISPRREQFQYHRGKQNDPLKSIQISVKKTNEHMNIHDGSDPAATGYESIISKEVTAPASQPSDHDNDNFTGLRQAKFDLQQRQNIQVKPKPSKISVKEHVVEEPKPQQEQLQPLIQYKKNLQIKTFNIALDTPKKKIFEIPKTDIKYVETSPQLRRKNVSAINTDAKQYSPDISPKYLNEYPLSPVTQKAKDKINFEDFSQPVDKMNATAKFIQQNEDLEGKNKVTAVPFPDDSKLLHTQSNFGAYIHKSFKQSKTLSKSPQKKVAQILIDSPEPFINNVQSRTSLNAQLKQGSTRQLRISGGKLSTRSPSQDQFDTENFMVKGKSGILVLKGQNSRSMVKIEQDAFNHNLSRDNSASFSLKLDPNIGKEGKSGLEPQK